MSDDDDDDFDPEGPDPHERDDDPDALPETIECPKCKTDFYEQAEQCPACGWYVDEREQPLGRKAIWVFVVLLAAIVAASWMMMR